MLKLPEELQKKYQTLLIKNEIPYNDHEVYKKWLRYYLDCCKKYKKPYIKPSSLTYFITKLKDKN